MESLYISFDILAFLLQSTGHFIIWNFKTFPPHPEEQYIYNLFQIPWITNLIPKKQILEILKLLLVY